MRKDFGAQTWIYPMPVLMIGTYDETGNPDLMTAAWGGIFNAKQIAVCIDKGHKTAENLKKKMAFTVSPADVSCLAACDYLGLVSAHEVPDKVAKAGFHVRKSAFADAPLFEELPFTLECRLISYNETTECALGEILNVSADETILDEKGKIDVRKLEPVCFDPVAHTYLKMGAIAGKAFSDGLKLK